MRERNFRDFGRGWVWLLAAAPLLVGCAKNRTEGAAPAPLPAAAPGASLSTPPSAAAPGAERGAPAGAAGLPAGNGKAAPEARQVGPSTLDNNRAAPRAGGKHAERFKSIAEAQAALERANRELVALYAPANKMTRAHAASADHASAAQRCGIACKAFASLERAADGVCRLAGEQDARCKHARHLVDVNRRRVASCGCPSSP